MDDFKDKFPELIKNKRWILLKSSLNEYDSIQITDLIEESS